MNHSLLTLAFLTLIFSGCANNTPNTDPQTVLPETGVADSSRQEIAKLNDYMTRFADPVQKFSVSSSSKSTVKGKLGTVITIDPADLETTDGKPVNDKIEIELKEIISRRGLLANNAQTVSNGQLLASGGAYYINMTSGGQQLKLKSGKALNVAFPQLTNKRMSLFYGQRDSLGRMNWQPGNDSFTSEERVVNQSQEVQESNMEYYPSDTGDIDAILNYADKGDTSWAKEYRIIAARKKMYDQLKITSFGWINCDRFPDIEDKMNYTVDIDTIGNIRSAHVFMVFKDINSVMEEYFWKGNQNNSLTFSNIPVCYKVRLIAFTIKDKVPYAYATDVIIGNSKQSNVSLQRTNDAALSKLLGN